MGIGSTKIRKGKNHLLLFAIDDYKHAPKLNNCVKDIKALREKFTKNFFFDEEYTKVLFNEKATRRGILNSISSIKKEADENDNLMIIFSGHGKKVHDQGFWIPFEADPEQDADFISTSDITQRLKSIKCKHVFMIIDACFSGTMIQKFRGDDDEDKEGLRPSRRVLTSSHSRELALDGTAGENSPFAEIILDYLDDNRNADIETKDLIRHVEKKVKEKTEEKQIPQSGVLAVDGHESGQLIIIPRSKLASFDYVLKLIKEEEFLEDGSADALKNFLLHYSKLPKSHALYVTFIANRINRWLNLNDKKLIIGLHRKRFEREIEILLDKTMQVLSKVEPLDTLDDDYLFILEKIAADEVEAALKRLIKKDGDKPAIFAELVGIITRFQLIERDLLNPKAQDGDDDLNLKGTNEEIENDYAEVVLNLVLLVERLIAGDEGLLDRASFIEKVLLEGDTNVEKIRFLISFLRFSPKNNPEIFFLLQSLLEAQGNLEYDVFAGNINPNKRKVVQTKINNGFSFIFNNLRQQEDQTLNPWLADVLERAPKQQYQLNNNLNYSQVLLTIFNGNFNQNKAYISSLLAQESQELKKLINGAKTKLLRVVSHTTDSSLKRYWKTIILTDMARLSRFIEEGENNAVHLDFSSLTTSSAANTPMVMAQAPLPAITYRPLRKLKISIARKDLQEVFQDLAAFSFRPEESLQIEILQLRFQNNHEDELFSQKNIQLINLRMNEIRRELLATIDEILNRLKPPKKA